MSRKYLEISSNRWFIALACFIFGGLAILGIRFMSYAPEAVHYHANFAVYVNSQQELFKGAQYYTETEMCTDEEPIMTPTSRAHMHDNINNVVHVEDHAVTWGQFFMNLGWYIGPNFIQSADGTMYVEDNTAKLHLILNGQDYTDRDDIANTVIADQDRLLVSFGNEGKSTLQKQYDAIPTTAHHYDISPDPASCGSHAGPSMRDRFMHLL